MWYIIISNRDSRTLEHLQEGPWKSKAHAALFAAAEIGRPYWIVKQIKQHQRSTYLTPDGYTLTLKGTTWTDGDLTFQAGPDGFPVTNHGEIL